MQLRALILTPLIALPLAACMQGQPESAQQAAPQPAAAHTGDPMPATGPVAVAPAPERVDVSDLPGTTIYHVNLNLVVDNPGEALSQAETLLRKLDGEVSYASSNPDNANLNGRVPVDARHQFRDALVKLAREIQSENMSTSDVGVEVRRLRRRLTTLQEADAQVARMVAGQSDPNQVEPAALLRELTERERQNIESQLQSYLTQTKDGQVNVSFTKPQ